MTEETIKEYLSVYAQSLYTTYKENEIPAFVFLDEL